MRRRHRLLADSPQGFELNVVPFIDIFSLLCTFLLFSAAFVSIGIHEVQVPFFTTATPKKAENVDQERQQLFLNVETIGITLKIKDKESGKVSFQKYGLKNEDLEDLGRNLMDLKIKNPKINKIHLEVDDEVSYDFFTKILAKVRFFPKEKGEKEWLFSRVVFVNLL